MIWKAPDSVSNISLKKSKYTVEFVLRWPAVSRFSFADQPKPLECDTGKISWLYRDGDTMNRRGMCDDRLYVAQIRANRDRTDTVAGAISTECN
jgi:hypothetical protein